jgi:peptidoglycan/xylan/chitin deacetylase (PgdA/CDA1 family)
VGRGLIALAVVVAVAGSTAVAGSDVGAGYPIYCGGHKGRYLALTFDDGPGSTTQSIISTLRRYHARATFFVLGQNVGGRSATIRQEKSLGEVANHSWSHPDLTKYSAAGVSEQLTSTQAAIRKAGGGRPRVFRPPYGAHNATVDSAARSLGLKEILWSVDSYDSRDYSTAQIAHTVLKLAQPGAIILLHDVIPNTLAALPRILRILEARKFQLVTVSELLKRDPPSLRQLRQGFQGCYAARASD